MSTVARDGDRDGLRRQRSRSIAIALSLVALVIVFYVATLIHLGPNALNKSAYNRPESGKVKIVTDPTGKSESFKGVDPDCKKAGTC
ncbi:MAG TPA: hypothetical protein PK264_03395 [Hyphomicrobiaceae bacterium]|nr:hypothetical protein [Hyphomicrobiaceae bacterium]